MVLHSSSELDMYITIAQDGRKENKVQFSSSDIWRVDIGTRHKNVLPGRTYANLNYYKKHIRLFSAQDYDKAKFYYDKLEADNEGDLIRLSIVYMTQHIRRTVIFRVQPELEIDEIISDGGFLPKSMSKVKR